MGRKAKFGDDVRQLAVELRQKGQTLADIQTEIRRRFGDAPEVMWISKVVRSPGAPSQQPQVDDLVATVDKQAAESESGADLDIAMLRRQLRQIEQLRESKDIGPANVASLGRIMLQTLTELRKREPPPPAPKETPPDWAAASVKGREKMHELLDRILESDK